MAKAKVTESRQVIDAVVQTEVVQYNKCRVTNCPIHGWSRDGAFPEGVNGPIQYGKNLQALVVSLNTVGAVSIARTHGATVFYGSATELRATLDYDLSEEKKFSYKGLSMDEIIHHLAVLISRLWQIHVFGEGNTRTTAVFFIKYLRTLGFDVTNDIFAENAWYFRNSLVRANYNDLKNGIHETTEYLELFLRNLLLNEDHPLHNRTLHISGMFKEMEKPDIGAAKPDIEKFKADIEELFQPKTTSHILKLREAFPGQSIFGRSDVMSVIEIKPSRASDLLKDMAEHGIIEPVTGHGKGKYRFKKQQD